MSELSSPRLSLELMAGMAGECIVVADLLLQGYRAFFAGQHCPYDVVADVGSRLIRIQVKSVSAPRRGRAKEIRPAYQWRAKRAGKKSQRVYASGEFDILACVALDLRLVAYIVEGKESQCLQVRVPGWEPPERNARGHRWNGYGKRGREFCDYTFSTALGALSAA